MQSFFVCKRKGGRMDTENKTISKIIDKKWIVLYNNKKGGNKMTYGKAILIFIIGLTIIFLLSPIIGMNATLLGMLILLIVTMGAIIKAAFNSVRMTNSK